MSRHVWSPGPLAFGGTEPAGLAEREAEAIVARPAPRGPARLRARCARARGAPLWARGRFGPALRRAVRDGRVRRVGRRTWAAVD